MINGGLAAIGVFRKHLSANSIKTKYPTIVRTAEEIEADELSGGNQMVVDDVSSSESEVEEKKLPAKKKNYTIDDIMSLDKSLKITKNKKEVVAVPVETKSKNIKKKSMLRNHRKSSSFENFRGLYTKCRVFSVLHTLLIK